MLQVKLGREENTLIDHDDTVDLMLACHDRRGGQGTVKLREPEGKEKWRPREQNETRRESDSLATGRADPQAQGACEPSRSLVSFSGRNAKRRPPVPWTQARITPQEEMACSSHGLGRATTVSGDELRQ